GDHRRPPEPRSHARVAGRRHPDPGQGAARAAAPDHRRPFGPRARARGAEPDPCFGRDQGRFVAMAGFDQNERIIELERLLEEANETLDAIRNGEVDAIVVGGADGQYVYTLENVDRPYRVLVEQMKEGAVTLNEHGLVLYANQSFADLVGREVGG